MSARHSALPCGCSSVEALSCVALEVAGRAALTQSPALLEAWPGDSSPFPPPATPKPPEARTHGDWQDKQALDPAVGCGLAARTQGPSWA